MIEYHKKIIIKNEKTIGYQYFLDKEHPLALSEGKVYLHRHIASLKIGRWLLSSEHVHHIDGNKKNNNPDNLEIKSASEHAREHLLERFIKNDFGTINLNCDFCKKTILKNKSNINKYKHHFCSQKCANFFNKRSGPPKMEILYKAISNSGSISEVSKKYNVSFNTIKKWVRYYLYGNYAKWTQEERNYVIKFIIELRNKNSK